MNRRQKAVWFLSGILTAVLVIPMVSPALALFSKTIQVYPGVTVYMDDKKLDPKDANGNPVEVFAYNGTTYLPVRAISEALGIPVQWDGNTQSVYLGKHTGDKPAVWVCDLDYFDKDGKWYFGETTKDNLGIEHSHSIDLSTNFKNDDEYVTYKLNGQYSYLTGLFYQAYDYRSSKDWNTLTIYADGEPVWKASVSSGKYPVEINVNVQSVKELKIELNCSGDYSERYCAIGELGLWT